jgi:aldose 1-epimerase
LLTCTNRSTEEMPCGLALHPYFPSSPRTVLDTEVKRVWTIDADVLPVSAEAPTGRYSLKRRAIGGQDLDNGYEGWSGRALIEWPENGIRLAMTSDAPRLQVYSPKGESFFSAEPATNANAALNATEEEWPALGLRVLKPGEAMTLSTRFELFAQ